MLDDAITKLGEYIRSGHNIAQENMPVGVIFMASGSLYVDYSLGFPYKADNAATAAEIITDFLKGKD